MSNSVRPSVTFSAPASLELASETNWSCCVPSAASCITMVVYATGVAPQTPGTPNAVPPLPSAHGVSYAPSGPLSAARNGVGLNAARSTASATAPVTTSAPSHAASRRQPRPRFSA